MWWCCGKPSKEAPGCKYSKHISKEDEDEQGDLDFISYGDNVNIKKMLCPVLIQLKVVVQRIRT